jgi:hypothetical protein
MVGACRRVAHRLRVDAARATRRLTGVRLSAVGHDDRRDVPIVAEDDDDADETMLVLERPATSEADAPGLSDVDPSDTDLPPPPPPPDDPLRRSAAPPPESPPPPAASPPPDLAGFDEEEEDDDATQFLSKERFLGEAPAGPSAEAAPPAGGHRRVRSLDGLGNMPLTEQTAANDRAPPAAATVSIVAEEDEDDDNDSPETAVHRPPPRRLSALMPIDLEEPEDVTLSRPIVHRRTFRPSGEGSPKATLDAAGGAPASAWAPKGARSVIALPVDGGASNTVQAKGPPAAPPPPTDAFDAQDETATSADPAADLTPDLESLGASLSNSGEGTDTALDLQPPVQPIHPESETRSLVQRPPDDAAADPDGGDHRGAPTAPAHEPIDDDISELDENALVVDDKLPSEISSGSRAAPGPDEGPPPTAQVEPAESKRGVFASGTGDAVVTPVAAAPVKTHVTEVQARSIELESIADDEPGTLIVQVPLEAIVFLDGAEVGQGPLSISGLDRFATYTLRVHCPGYLPWSGAATLRGEAEAEVVPGLRSRQG